MDNLSFHITDITANSIRAKASDIEIDIQIKDTSICIRIADNGCGMDPETVSLIRNPFYTTRTTRKVGLGLPFLIQNAEQTGGNVVVCPGVTIGNRCIIAAGSVVTKDIPPY